MPRRNINNLQFETTLSANINDSVTSFNVAAVTDFPATPFGITINGEGMEVTDVSGTTLTVTRGFDGTTAASHTSGDAVKFAVFAVDFHSAGISPDGQIGILDPFLPTDVDKFAPSNRVAFSTALPWPGTFSETAANYTDRATSLALVVVPQDGFIKNLEYKVPGTLYVSGFEPGIDEVKFSLAVYRGKWTNPGYFPDVGDSPVIEEEFDATAQEGLYTLVTLATKVAVTKGEPLWVGVGMHNNGNPGFIAYSTETEIYTPIELPNNRVWPGNPSNPAVGVTLGNGSPFGEWPTWPASPGYRGWVPWVSLQYALTTDS